MPDAPFTISREDAAAKLGVSTRTLDRWLKSGKMPFVTEGRNVFVHAGKVRELMEQGEVRGDERGGREEGFFTGTQVAAVQEESLYKKLYEDTAAVLKEKQDKLEAASFRVGQLEATIANSVPLLEHKAESERLLGEALAVRGKYEMERMKSRIFMVASGVFFAGLLGVLGWLLWLAW